MRSPLILKRAIPTVSYALRSFILDMPTSDILRLKLNKQNLSQPMPKKIGDLKRILQKAGFTLLPKRGKGSHSYWIHPLLSKPVVISGQ